MAAPLSLDGSNSRRFWMSEDNVFSRRSSQIQRENDDEEALKWAALEKLPTYDRVRKAILKNVAEESGNVTLNEIDVTELAIQDRSRLIERILKVTEEDNERLLLKLRDRVDKVGIDLPRIEVRFEHLDLEASVHVGSRALPSFWNFTLNIGETILNLLHLLPGEKKTLRILKDISGIIRPSRMTLLLGPPASGKTTLLLALANKLDHDLKVSGRVTYNGHDFNEFVAQRTSAYISQYDLHTAEMTVRETLDFSSRCQGVGTSYEMLTELSRREKIAGIKPDPDIDVFMKATAISGEQTSLVTDYVLKILGLDICADTLVGDNMRRGVSGGQKKRVTTGEIIVGPAKALFMDEISTGLDSSTTYQIVKCLRQSVHVLDGTMLISLLQPAPETYELFDDLILLAEGEIVYQGPRELVIDFFEFMGFRCPERKGVADFLQEVTSKKDQEQYWVDKTLAYRYITVTEFANAFKSFHVGEKIHEELSTPFDRSRSHPAALTTTKYALSSVELFKACMAREWLLAKRNSFVYIFKTVQVFVTAIITMTLFLRTKMHTDTTADGALYMGALFYAMVHIMFNGFAELSMTLSRLPVFYRQRDLLFYPPWAYGLPIFVLRIPLSIIEALVWVCTAYYVIGLAPSPGRFFGQALILFLIHQMAMSLFRLIAALGRTKVIAFTFGTSALMIVFILGGFIISRKSIPGWWIWGYWISPLMYGQNSIAVNEFLADRWQKPDPDYPTTTIGNAVLESRGLFPHAYWFWLGVGGLIGFTALFNIIFVLALEFLNPIGKHQAIIEDDAANKKRKSTKNQGNPYAQHPLHNKNSLLLSLSRSNKCSTSANVRMSELSISNSHGPNQLASVSDESSRQSARKGMILPFQPLSLAFDEVNYYVDMPPEMKEHVFIEDRLQLLRSVSGSFRPGVLTALVGVSGAGKTTLMDVLAGRKTGGYIEGSITISGFPKKQDTFARISGYCEQNDIHSPNLTVHESLIYSAWLRLSNDVGKATKKMFVEEVMELVELDSLRNFLVGIPGENGLSTEQRKRLTVAVELVANPSIIFMDEPTSGLDARAAAIVMRTVRNTVDTGRTVVCTIHQPSIDIFEAFDELLLMTRGGQVIYAGQLGRNSCKLIEFFEAIDGVPKIKEGYNPATWMLEVTAISAETRLGVDFAEIYRNSSLYERNKQLIKELMTPAPGAIDLHFTTKYAQSFFFQCLACLWKQRISYWRNPYYTAIRFYFTIAAAVMFGSIFWRLGNKKTELSDINNLMGSIFASVLFLGINNSSSVQPVVSVERTVYYRERAAGLYSALPYAIAQAVIEIPYIIIQASAYTIIVYAMVDFQWTVAKFFWYWYFMIMTLLYFTYYGMMAIAVTPNDHIAAIISSTFYGIWNLFSGFIIPRPSMPVWWRWYAWANPIQWTTYGVVVSQIGDDEGDFIHVSSRSPPVTVPQYLRSRYGFRHRFLGGIALGEVLFVLMFAVVFALAIRHLNFQKR